MSRVRIPWSRFTIIVSVISATTRGGSARHRRAAVFTAALVLATFASALASPGSRVGAERFVPGLPDYWTDSRFLADVPGASSSVAAGLFNPAVWSARPGGGLFLAYLDPTDGSSRLGPAWDPGDRGEWIGVLSARRLAFGIRSAPLDESLRRGSRWTEYTLGLSGGNRSGSAGLSYSWSRDGKGRAMRGDRLAMGAVHRWRPLSFGVSSLWDRDGDDYFVQADLGVRPVGSRLTLFAEAACRKGDDFDQVRSAYGFELHPVRGIALGAKALSTGEFGLSFRLGLARGLHPEARMLFDDSGDRVATVVAVETDLPSPSLGLEPCARNYPEMAWKGPIVYQRYRFFDERTTLLETLRRIDEAASDPQVGGVVLNISGIQASPAVLWELREQLAGLRARGKKVILYFDRTGMAGYGLASVADRIWMDPQGDLEIPGLAFGRTYMRGLLDKMGMGIDELRFFTYKSAAEGLSRTTMSEADREQLGAMVDDFYETLASCVTVSRGISREAWDRLVDEKGSLLPAEALEAGLVDSIGTFEKAKESARKAEARTTGDPSFAPVGAVLGDPVWSETEWGEPAGIAVLYGIGVCDMETGIRGPVLAKKIKDAAKDRHVKAIVLRADSPGGDALPSDLVARELKAAAEKKPVIVSQGQVAGSGGYWISMDADTIVATPLTLTGSIGVIGAWLYDKGLGDKLGITFDLVQRGKHADLGRGMTLPLIQAVVPERAMDAEERARAEQMIRTLYTDFVGKVAAGRGMTEEQVDHVGQGRIWSGTRGKEKGLVDEIGGLWRSIEIARAAANIPSDRPIQFTEGPQIGAFNIPFPSFRLLGIGNSGAATAREGGAAASPAHGDLPLTRVGALESAAGAPLSLSEYERAYLEFVLRAGGSPLLLTEPILGPEGMAP